MGADLLDHALEYLQRYGWSIIPIRNLGHKKKAACRWKKYQTRRPTMGELKSMFRLPGLTGLAVVLGEVSGGLWARDFDKPEAYPKWAAAYPDVARAIPKVLASRGPHLYGIWPHVQFEELPDGELQAEGGHYCLLPPARHPSGHIYSWESGLPSEIPRLDPATVGLNKTWGGVTQGTQGTQGTQALSGMEKGCANPERAGGVPPDLLREAIPDGPSQNHRALFDLARRVRGLEVERGGAYSMAALREALAAWCAANPHLNPEKAEVDYMAEFLEAYGDIRVPYGTPGTLDLAWEAAQTAPPIPEAAQFGEAFGLLAAWCRELQRTAGGRAFYLGSRTVADRFGLSAPLLAWRRLRLLVRLGIIELREPGDRRRAAAFKYLLPLE